MDIKSQLCRECGEVDCLLAMAIVGRENNWVGFLTQRYLRGVLISFYLHIPIIGEAKHKGGRRFDGAGW